MARRVIEADGRRWVVAPSGRATQYVKDEFGLVFTAVDGDPAERRAIRYSPRGAKSVDRALAQLSDADLRDLLARAQPAWTAPELGYRR